MWQIVFLILRAGATVSYPLEDYRFESADACWNAALTLTYESERGLHVALRPQTNGEKQIPTREDMDHLTKVPTSAPKFDAWFGEGAAREVLGDGVKIKPFHKLYGSKNLDIAYVCMSSEPS